MDPDSETIFRFYEVEYSLACGMDGERDVPGIVKWAQDELGLSPSPQEVRTVIATLGDLGFIATGEAAAQPSPAEHAPSAVVTPQARPHAPAEHAPEPVAPAPRAPGATGRRPVQTPDDSALEVPGRASDRPTPRAFEASTPETPAAPPASAASAVPPAPPISSASSVSKAHPDVSDVSIDLSDHIAVRPDDVKEAVRASRVLAAVEVPKDLLDALEDKPAERASGSASASFPKQPSAGTLDPVPPLARPAELPRPAEIARPAELPRPAEITRPAELPKPVQITRPAEAKGDAKPERGPLSRPPNDTAAARPPVELPKAPVAKPVPPPAPSSRVSPVLIVVLVLVVLGAGAFLVWKYVLEGQGTGTQTSTAPAVQPVKPPPAPAPPPPPPAPAAKIGMQAPAPEEIKLAQSGVIDTIVADGTVVKAGDEIVKLGGYKPLEAAAAATTGSVTRLKAQIEALTKQRAAAEAAGNKAMETTAVADLEERQKALAGKEELLAGRKKELDKFVIRAPANGTFTREAKPSTKVAAETVVGKLQREAIPTATFKIGDTKPFTANASIEITVGKGEQHVTCTLAEVQPDSVKVVCPADPALVDGTDVTLKVPGATPEAAPTQPAVPAPTQPPASGQPPAPAAPAAGSAGSADSK